MKNKKWDKPILNEIIDIVMIVLAFYAIKQIKVKL